MKQQGSRREDGSFPSWAAGLVTVSFVLAITGCRPAAPDGGGAPAPEPQAEGPDASKDKAVADPDLREAREQADAILGSLLAGTLDKDPELSPLARKVKGSRSCSIKSQKIVRDGAADFRGVLDSPTGRACFDMTLVRQVSGRWTVGTFSGPPP